LNKGGIMWSKSQAVAEPPAASPAPGSSSPVVPFSVPSASRLGSSPSRSSARLGASIQIKGHVTGDISTARISIEDGAHFKGRIEIDPTKSQAAAD